MREERPAREEGEGKKESKPGWVEEIEERVTEGSVCYRGKKERLRESKRERESG